MRLSGRTIAISAMLLTLALEICLIRWPAVSPRVGGAAVTFGVGLAAAAHVRAARRGRGHARHVWFASSAGLVMWLLTLLWYNRDEVLANRVSTHTWPMDLLSLCAFAAAVTAMLLIPGVPRTFTGRLRMGLDGLLLTAAGVGVAWLLVLRDLAMAPGADLADPITLVFPIAAIAVLSVALLLIAGARHQGTGQTFFCAGIALIALSVLITSVTLLDGSRPDRDGGQGLMLGAALLLAAAAFRPLPDRQVEAWDPSTPIARFLPYAMIGVFAVAAGYGRLRDVIVIDDMLVWLGAILGAALLARQILALRFTAALAEALAEHRRAAHHAAHHDPLTGLANRTLLAQRLTVAVTDLPGPEVLQFAPGPALLLIDLDGFKAINDSLGHAAGDQVLVAVADRLRRWAGDADMVARLGADEFAILLHRVAGPAGAAAAADEVLRLLSVPETLGRIRSTYDSGPSSFGLPPREVTLRASIGAAVADVLHRDDADRLLRDAAVALQAAKGDGKGRFRVSDAALRAGAVDQIVLDIEMRGALAKGQFEVHYQPIIELATGQVAGAEALLRWRHPTRGMVSPGAFLPAAEAAGLLPDIDRWVMREACRQGTIWRRKVSHFSVSVNVSAGHVTHAALANDVTEALAATGLPAGALILELTETALLADTTTAAGVLVELAKLGVRVALDDFGTGYSSLTYLRTLPIHSIKIDRSFVSGLGDGGTNDAVTRAIVDLAGTLGLQQVAEGVETVEQAARMRRLGCTYAQGYHYSHPVPPERLSEIISDATVRLPV